MQPSSYPALEAIGYAYLAGCLIVITLLGVIPCGAMWWHGRYKQMHGLRHNVKLPDGVVVLSSSAEIAEAVEVVTAAWAGSDSYAAQPEALHQWICDAGRQSSESARRALLRWMVRFHFAYARACPGTVCFGVRSDDGTLAAAALVVPYIDGLPEQRSQVGFFRPRGPFIGSLREAMRRFRAAVSVGALTDKTVSKRFLETRAVARKAHQRACASARPHLHVGPLAVKPAAQGKKHASTLLAHVYACAFDLSVGLYLECSGERPKAIFTRFGYRPFSDAPFAVGLEEESKGAGQHEHEPTPATATVMADGDTSSSDDVFRELWVMEMPVLWAERKGRAEGAKYVWPKGGGAAVWVE